MWPTFLSSFGYLLLDVSTMSFYFVFIDSKLNLLPVLSALKYDVKK